AVRRVDAAIYAAKPVSNQSLGLLRKFWVLSSSLCVACKKSPWNGTWSAWLTISNGSISSYTLAARSQEHRKRLNQRRQPLLTCWANFSAALFWHFNDFFARQS